MQGQGRAREGFEALQETALRSGGAALNAMALPSPSSMKFSFFLSFYLHNARPLFSSPQDLPRAFCERGRTHLFYSSRGSRAFRGVAVAGAQRGKGASSSASKESGETKRRREKAIEQWRAKFNREGGAGVSALGGDQAVYSTASRCFWS